MKFRRLGFLVFILALGLCAWTSPAQAYYQVVKADSISLSSAGDTGTITFSQEINAYELTVTGGDVHHSIGSVDALQTDLLQKSGDPPYKSPNFTDFTEIDVVADSANASAVTVHVRGLRLN